jgi:hypothetical protein
VNNNVGINDRTGTIPIPVFMVDPNFWRASGLFNPNAFSPQVKRDVEICCDQYAILLHSVQIVCDEPGLDATSRLQQLRSNGAFKGFKPLSDKPIIITFHNLDFLGGVYATLISMKSLLDCYSRLISRLLVSSTSVFGFTKGVYRGRKISGGKFLNWIEHSAPEGFEKRNELVDVLLRHVDDWIGNAVSYRDAAIHSGFINGMQEVRIPVIDYFDKLQEKDILMPTMPDGVLVKEYCIKLAENARCLIAETLVLLPDVDVKLLSLNESGVI